MTEKQESKFTEHILYGGEVKVKFFNESHQYWVAVGGEKSKRKKGVSTISGVLDKSIGLQKWQQQLTADFLLGKIDRMENIGHDEILEAVLQCELKKEEAGKIGTKIHDYINKYILHKMGKGDMPGEPEQKEIAQGFSAFLDWEKQQKEIKYHHTERIVYSKKYDYIGCLDLDATINGKRAIVDFKSSNGLYNSVNAQTSGYDIASEEEDGNKVYEEHWAIRVAKYSEEEYYAKERQKNELKKFMAKIQGKEYKEYPIKPYQVFEAKLLAGNKKELKRDRDAFLNMLKLYEWNIITNTFSN